MTPQGHSIRLHGPWESSSLNPAPGLFIDGVPASLVNFDLRASGESNPRPAKVQIPEHWPAWWASTSFDAVRLERRFGLPTGLEPEQKIWLVVKAKHLAVSFNLNQVALGDLSFTETHFEFSIRPHLLSRNCLRLDIQSAHQESGNQMLARGGWIQAILLEIR